eukprot:TRINITY_DN14369_c0_g1_i4.p1 TRINITY_DN14369_c0_g1~~TRINITY_DN14369_c0_g1_i4.p1  ORF type:complete len:270 (-),score=38.02 TRINITY_DN14369_c0_g1_i4:55-864(-)
MSALFTQTARPAKSSRGPIHSYPTRNYDYYPTYPGPSASELKCLPPQLPVLTSYKDIQRMVDRALSSGDRLVVSVDRVHCGVSINRANSLPPRVTHSERQHFILNSLDELQRLASSAQPMAARPDVQQNGMWIVPEQDVHSVAFTALQTLDEMLRCAATLAGAHALTDGETAVIERIGYFLRSEHEDVAYSTALVVSALCRHASPVIDASLRLSPVLMESLQLVASPEHGAPERTHRQVVAALDLLGRTTARRPVSLSLIHISEPTRPY